MEMELREGLASRITVPAGLPEVLVFDTKQRGFFLRKYASGKTDYGVMYTANGKRRKVMLGRDATVKGNLAKARQEAEDVRARARIDGRDVIDERRAATAAAARAVTVLDAAKRFVEARKAALRPRYHLELVRHLLGTEGCPAVWRSLHGKDLGAVTRADVVRVLDDAEEAHGLTAADRAKASFSSLYTWAIERGLCEATPVYKIKPRATGGSRERALTASELREVWAACDAVNDDYGQIVRLLILTGQRREEIGGLQWSEVLSNGAAGSDGPRIELPGSRTKNHRAHIVPLSPLAARQLPKKREGWPFLYGRRQASGFSGWSKSKTELDEAIADARKRRKVREAMPHWTVHDLRRTFVTMVAELGMAQPHVIEVLVNHVSGHKAGVAGTYNKALYSTERRTVLEAWSQWIEANVAV